MGLEQQAAILPEGFPELEPSLFHPSFLRVHFGLLPGFLSML